MAGAYWFGPTNHNPAIPPVSEGDRTSPLTAQATEAHIVQSDDTVVKEPNSEANGDQFVDEGSSSMTADEATAVVPPSMTPRRSTATIISSATSSGQAFNSTAVPSVIVVEHSTPTVQEHSRETVLLETFRAYTEVDRTAFSYASTNPPTIDGDLSDWPSSSFTEVRHTVFKPENNSGPSDLSASFATVWTSSHLYLAVRSYDETLVQIESGAFLYQGDSVELYVDSDLEGDISEAQLSSDDYQIGILPGAVFESNSEVYRWYPRQREGILDTVIVGAHITEEGYQVEVMIPWSEMGIEPQAESIYGFGISVNDNDAPGTAAQESLISFSPTHRLTDPTTWGRLILMRSP